MTREEAIKEIKSWDFLEGKEIEAIQTLIPELSESEDERIRRKIIEHFKAKTKETWCNMPVKDIISYLEKQEIFSKGEGLYYYRPDGDCTFIGTGLGPVEDIKLNGERPKTENKGVDLPGTCLCVENQKEPHKRLRDKTPWIVTAKEELAHALKNVNLYTKPIDYDHEMWKNCEANFEGGKKEVIDHPEKYGLQKSAEWNANDKAFIKDCARILDENGYTASAERLLSMFGQKPVSISCGHENDAEWDKEDKEKIVTISEIIEHCTTIPYSGGTLTLNKEYKKELLCFIRTLRPQYHGDVTMTEAYKMGLEAGKASSWKPSEEQMKALINCVIGNEYDVHALVRLWAELKKL